ncbi:hypothetical protein ON010_g582 [Phytophthora cinnamomi]|nr:hypothetical protein ON010_g582 [Phytophthora cinnamomi]
MRLYASRFGPVLVVLLTIGIHHTTEASTCKTLLDSDSTLTKSLASWTQTDLSPVDFPTVFKEINTALPWLSKCAAAIDPKAVYTSLASSSTVKNCLSSLEHINGDLSTNEGWSTMCPMVDDTIVPLRVGVATTSSTNLRRCLAATRMESVFTMVYAGLARVKEGRVEDVGAEAGELNCEGVAASVIIHG